MTPTTEVLRAMIEDAEAGIEANEWAVENYRTKAARDRCAKPLPGMRAEHAALKLALADVERYRWLKSRYTVTLLSGRKEFRVEYITADKDGSIDAAIDQARTAQDGGQGVNNAK